MLDYTNTYSARAAFQKSKQYDGFEIIDDDEQKEKDAALLSRQVKGLLASVPIKIEEKGYLLQLMHDYNMRCCLTDIFIDINQPL